MHISTCYQLTLYLIPGVTWKIQVIIVLIQSEVKHASDEVFPGTLGPEMPGSAILGICTYASCNDKTVRNYKMVLATSFH